MAIIQSSKPEGGYEKQQGVLVPKRGVYYGILARYTLPKEYTNKWGTKEKLGFGFVITHDQAYRQLPQFADAFILVPNTLFHDAQKLTSSKLVEYLFAFHYGKKTKAEIIEGIYDYDDFIGRPVSLLVEPGTPGQDGFAYNNITGVDPIDKEAAAAMKPILATRKFEKNEKTGLTYMAEPKGAVVDGGAPAPSGDEGPNFDGLDEEVPW